MLTGLLTFTRFSIHGFHESSITLAIKSFTIQFIGAGTVLAIPWCATLIEINTISFWLIQHHTLRTLTVEETRLVDACSTVTWTVCAFVDIYRKTIFCVLFVHLKWKPSGSSFYSRLIMSSKSGSSHKAIRWRIKCPYKGMPVIHLHSIAVSRTNGFVFFFFKKKKIKNFKKLKINKI